MSESTQGYIVLTPTRVEALLLVHPSLVDFLQDLPAQLAPYFPFPGTQLSLQVEDDGETYLFVGVHTALSPGDAYLKMGEFDEAWLLEHEPDEVIVDVDFARIEEGLYDATRL